MRFFTTFLAAMLVTLSVSAGNVELKKMAHATAQPTGEQTIAAAQTITMTKVVAAYFQRDNKASSYYIVLSDSENTTYDPTTAQISAKNCTVLSLDLYSQKTATAILESDLFTPATGTVQSGNYNPEYSFAQKYNFAGKPSNSDDDFITGNISVTRLDGDNNYHIEATALNGNTYVYEGRINFLDSNSSSYVYPQIQSDINVDYTGAMAFYNGDMYESKTGNMYINLFSCEFDPETGAMNGIGYNLSICSFGKLFGNPDAATIIPGTYTVATNFKNGTYYPGIELTAQGITVPFGTYVKQRKAMTGSDSDYAFTYINNGTVIIEANEDGTYNFTVDLFTADGFKVTGSAKNINVSLVIQAEPEVHISNLTEDVVLDLNYIKEARLYTNNREGVDGHGYKRFLLDIGSPSGKDGTEGDIFRMELLTNINAPVPPAGVYNVMEYDQNYYNLFAPYQLIQGYFYEGGLDGTRYMHFEEGKYCVMDLLAPIVAGSISFEKAEGVDNYHFVIDVYDDAGFSISGEWTGSIPGYDASIDDVISDKELTISYLDNENIALNNIGGTELVKLYAPDGRLVFSQYGATLINLGGLTNGIYILHVESYKSIKIIKK